MRDYEVVLVLSSKLTKAKQDAILDKVKKIGAEGKVELREWGKKELAYPLAKQKEGVYFLMQAKFDAGNLGKLDRELKIEEGVLRHLILRVD